MNKICVYAIAKDEEQFCERWYKSVAPADKIIVLDTGSTDNTVEILSSLGVEVHQKKYDHFRFDVARNDCLDLIPDEYNIRVSIDLDEIFSSDKWADVLKEKWDEDNPRVVYKYIWAHNNTGSNGLEFMINKIHGRDPNLRWEGAVHEHLINTITGKREFDKYIDLTKDSNLDVHHYPDLSRDRLFYKDLAYERIQEHPDDYQAITLLANEERVKGDPEKAIELYNIALRDFQEEMSETEIAAIYYALGQSHEKVGHGVAAMIAYSAGIAENKLYRDNYYGLGVLMIKNEMYEMAIGVLEEALKTSIRFYFWMEDNYTWTYAIYDALGVAYGRIGKNDKALGYAAKALSFEPTNETLINNYNTYLESL